MENEDSTIENEDSSIENDDSYRYNAVFVVWIIIVFVGMVIGYLVIRDGETRDASGKSKIEQSRTKGENYYPFVFGALGGQVISVHVECILSAF